MMIHYPLIILLLISICMQISLSTPIVSTSITVTPLPITGAIVGYDAANQTVVILGGQWQLADGRLLDNDFFLYIPLETAPMLYDEDNAPINTSSDIPNWFKPANPSKMYCLHQCATQINNRLYILNPLANPQTVSIFGSGVMLIHDLSTREYVDPSQYVENIPNFGQWDPTTHGCVVNDGSLIYIFGNSYQGIGQCTDTSAPDNGAFGCPVTDLYAYNPTTDTWTTKAQPAIPWRYKIGCAVSPDDQYIYIFGGISRTNPTVRDFDVSVRETEKYTIADDSYEVLSNADLSEARWDMMSFVSFTENRIYLYGGFRYEEPTPVDSEELDSKVMSVFDINTESFVQYIDTVETRPEWNAGHFRLGLSNTLPLRDVCNYEIGVSVGSFDFDDRRYVNQIQLLRFTDDVLDEGLYPDNSIIINPVTDLENTVFDAYTRQTFVFEVVVTEGAPFLPDVSNVDILLTDWQNDTYNLEELDSAYTRYTQRQNGIVRVMNVESEFQDNDLFNKCNGVSNVVENMRIRIAISRSRRSYCGQTMQNRLRRWMFRDSDPDGDGVNDYTTSIKLVLTNPSDETDKVYSDSYELVHDCSVSVP